MKISPFLTLGFWVFTFISQASPIPYPELENQLKGDGLKGWIHGSAHPLNLYVFTYRTPGDFFSHSEFPLVAGTDSVEKTLQSLTRHDEVSLKGHFLANGAPIRHIFVEALSVIKKYESPSPAPEPYPYQADLPKDLLNQTEIFAKVHAIANGGKVMVVEYKDAIVPVVVGKPELAANLYRNDKVRLKIQVRSHPERPTHVSLDLMQPEPLTVIDSMVAWHGRPGSVEGALVMFPKSPQVNFNVFALQVEDDKGLIREFTLVNFEDTQVFEKIRQKLQEIWDSSLSSVENGRNKLINKKLRLKATGTFNVVDPGQANPQLLLTDPKGVEVIVN